MESSAKENLFPKLIKEIRDEIGITQKELGELLEPPIRAQSVGQWERGENEPDRKYWQQLAALLQMDVEEFYIYIGTGVRHKSSPTEKLIEKIHSLPLWQFKEVARFINERLMKVDEDKSAINSKHLALLKKGTKAWNRWRENNPDVRPELYGVDISSLGNIDLEGVDLSSADLREAKLECANLIGADLIGCNLENAQLESANLSRADLRSAKLKNANLSNAYLVSADLQGANLQGANLEWTSLQRANLKKTNSSQANLNGADLRWAILDNTNLEGAILKRCSVYGASVWEVKLDGAKQERLNTSDEGDRVRSQNTICVDNLKLASILHAINHEPLLYQLLKQHIEVDVVDVAAEVIKALVRGKQPSSEEIAELARSLELSEEELLEMCDRLFSEKTS
ncbi:pentapeptide repeat-containing protein [Oscillatoria sp. FACHB-1406]|uniref:pentapeptide repeat-containing protein n=1 Tax=Oscillatoria sp. FACHB-1406 TaxID=2692846 RepID=UPI0016824C2C|nr:pentapeptide repeat-containing protein [Oscillatoria sp. FACHB-1406]MBD2580154.1 pentapeptide repeat-containing protein [Oscillatoria sp. FACHB-1406]